MAEPTIQAIEPASGNVASSPAAVAPQDTASGAPASVPASAPSPEPAPGGEAAPAALKPHTDEPSLLTQALQEIDAKAKPKDPEKPAEPAKADAKPDDKKPAEAAKPEGEIAPEPVKLDPVDYKYTLPETLKMDDAMRAETHTAFDAFRADPTNPQPLIDLHNKAMQAFVDEHAKGALQAQHDAFREMRKERGKEIMADEVLGGSGFETTKATVARMRDKLVRPQFLELRTWGDGTPRPSKFQEFLETTGAGDFDVFWDILHNAARYADEPQARDQPTDIKPPKDIARAPGSKRLYRQPAPRQQ